MNFTKLIIFVFFFLQCFFLSAQTTDSLIVADNDSTVIDTIATVEPINTVIKTAVDSINPDTPKNAEISSETTIPASNNLDSQNRNLLAEDLGLEDTIIVKFVKEYVSQGPDSLYFNILKISNFTKEKINGELIFSCPEGWNLISTSGTKLELLPDDSAFIPVRLAINKESIGALSYILNATFKTDDEIFSSNAYISIPGFRRWYLNVDKSVVHFNEYNENVNIKVTLSNKGNVTEIVRLEYKIGNLVLTDGIDKFNNITYVTLPPNKDSIINLKVKYNNTLSYNDIRIYRNNWKESSIEVFAEVLGEKQKRSIWFKKLESNYFGKKIGGTSPLNVGLTFMNLLSDFVIRVNPEVYGTILFPSDRDLYYKFQFYSMPLNRAAMQNFDFNRQSNFIIGYEDKKVYARIGDNLGGSGGLQSYSGRGILVGYKLDKYSKIEAGVMKSKVSYNNIGGYLKYNTIIRSISLRAGLGFEENKTINNNSYSLLVGAGYTFLKNHRLYLDLLGANSYFSNLADYTNSTTSGDTAVYGFGYKAGYAFNSQPFKFRLMYSDLSNTYTRGSRGQFIDVNSNYTFKNNYRIDLIYNRRKTYSLTYPNRFYNKSLFYINDIGRALFYIPTKSAITYSIGPYVTNYIRQTYDNGFYVETKTFNPKIYVGANMRLSTYKSVSGYLTSGLSFIKYKSDDISIGEINLKGKPNYSLGATYSSRAWRLNVSYNIGSVSDLYYNLYYYVNNPASKVINKNSESLMIRPSYEKYLYSDKIKFMAFANYIYTMPSERENIAFNAMFFINLNRGWTVNFSGNVFFNAREDEENGRIVSKDFNIQLGIRKAFDIQQPRLKHRDLTIVCFQDLNGNKIKDENEPPLANIQITFERSAPLADSGEEDKLFSNFALIELVTSPDGAVYYGNIPEGIYSINIKPLINLKDIYNVNGENQTVRITSNTTLYVPFSETYKVKGRVLVERDEFSSEGLIFSEGIRVSATDPNGETYSVLTDKNGYYVLSLPQSQTYKVKINNVFGEQFMVEKDEYLLHFNGIKVISVDFKFIEKKRKVNFNNNIESLYIFNSINTNKKPKSFTKSFDADVDTSQVLNFIDKILDSKTKTPTLSDSDFMAVTIVDEKGIVFKIDLYSEINTKKTIGELKTLPKVICIEGENNGFRYLANSYKAYSEAKTFCEELKTLGFENAKVVAFEDGEEITLEDAGVTQEE